MAKTRLDGLRVAALAADGFEQLELTPPRKMLLRRGATVEVISLRPGKIRGVNGFLPGKKVEVDRTVWTADPSDYDALFIPGGFVNPDMLRQSEEVLDFVRAFEAAGKPIAVICHAPWVLISAGLVRGRRLTSWPGIKDDVINAGGIWVDEGKVRDGNWVSSRGPQDLHIFPRAMIELFAEYAPARVGTAAAREEEEGSRFPLGGLIAAGVAAAAVGYAVRNWRRPGADSVTVGTETLVEGDRVSVTAVEEEVGVAAPASREFGATPAGR